MEVIWWPCRTRSLFSDPIVTLNVDDLNMEVARQVLTDTSAETVGHTHHPSSFNNRQSQNLKLSLKITSTFSSTVQKCVFFRVSLYTREGKPTSNRTLGQLKPMIGPARPKTKAREAQHREQTQTHTQTTESHHNADRALIIDEHGLAFPAASGVSHNRWRLDMETVSTLSR